MFWSIRKQVVLPAMVALWGAASTQQASAQCVTGQWVQPPNFIFDANNGSFPTRAESAHFVLRWPSNKPDLLTADEARGVLEAMERIYAWFVGPTVRWPEPFCTSATKYKFTIFSDDGYAVTGSGTGANGVEAPAMWVRPTTLRAAATGLSDRISDMVHEFTHAMQFASQGMRNTELGGWFWESHAEFMSTHYPGSDGKVGCSSMSALQPHLFYGNIRLRYCNWQFWSHIKNKYGFAAVNNIWAKTAGVVGQDPLATLMRNQGWSAAQLGDEFGHYAMRNVAWDYVDAESGFDRGSVLRSVYGSNTDLGVAPDWQVSKRLRLTHLAPIDVAQRRFVVPSYWAPQRYGYNHVRLIPDAGSTAVTVNFRGVVQDRIAAGAEVGGSMAYEPGATPKWSDFLMPQTPASNWRWGVVVIEGSGKPRYSALQRGSSGSLRVPLLSTDREVYLVVAAAPDDYHALFGDQKYNTVYRYPFKVELLGALPDGYQPNFDLRASRQYPPGRRHANGGGWVADGAQVSSSAFVGPNAAVLGGIVLGNARIEDHAIVWNGTVQDNAVVGGLTQLNANPTVADSAVIRSVLAIGPTWHDRDVIRGTAILFGDLETYTNAVPITKGVFSGFGNPEIYNDAAHGASRTRLPIEVTAPTPGGWPNVGSPPPPPANQPPASAVNCAAENGTCTIPAGTTATVYYGAGTTWAVRTGVTGSIGCNNTVFGDPAPTIGKSCRYQATGTAPPPPPPPPPSATGTGLTAQYFSNAGLSGAAVLTRVEAPSFNWGTRAPATGLPADNFSVRWVGQLQAVEAGAYQFRTNSDDSVRVWIDGTPVINNWTPHTATLDTTGPIPLAAGQRVPITIEYAERSGAAVMQLSWLRPGGTWTPVPATQLLASSGLPANALAEWTFDTAAGTTALDSSGNGRSLTLGAGVTVNPAGKRGSALRFAGPNSPSGANTAAAVLNTAGSFSVSGFIRFDQLPECWNQAMASQDGVTVSGFFLGIAPPCNGSPARATFAMMPADADAGPSYRIDDTTTVVAGTWYHLVAVRDAAANTMSLYVNGRLAGTTTNPTKWAANGGFALGRSKFSGVVRDQAYASIDGVRAYGRALSAAEVQSLFMGDR